MIPPPTLFLFPHVQLVRAPAVHNLIFHLVAATAAECIARASLVLYSSCRMFLYFKFNKIRYKFGLWLVQALFINRKLYVKTFRVSDSWTFCRGGGSLRATPPSSLAYTSIRHHPGQMVGRCRSVELPLPVREIAAPLFSIASVSLRRSTYLPY